MDLNWSQSTKLENLHRSWNRSRTAQNGFFDVEGSIGFWQQENYRWWCPSSLARCDFRQRPFALCLVFLSWIPQSRDSFRNLQKTRCFRPRVGHTLLYFWLVGIDLSNEYINLNYQGCIRWRMCASSPVYKNIFHFLCSSQPIFECQIFFAYIAGVVRYTFGPHTRYQMASN